MARGKFISIEGGEGVGKSTQIAALAAIIRERGHDVILTREPGGTDGAEAIRRLLLEEKDTRLDARSEALLFAAARANHVAQLIRPALDDGKWVISDRFVDSSRAYQGDGSDISDADILSLHRFGSLGLLPDRTLVLQMPEEEANARASLRDNGQHDRISGRGREYHANVAKAFRKFASDEPDRVRCVNAQGTRQEVTDRLRYEIEDLL